MANSRDLKQIGEIYNECIQTIRSQPLEGFDSEARLWLKNARYRIMKDIEENFFTLERSIHNPLLRPGWAIHPSDHLNIFTDRQPPILAPYSDAIISNLKQLMDDCGLNANVTYTRGYGTSPSFYCVKLHFPLTNSYPKATGTLVVNDEFSSNPSANLSKSMRRLLADRPYSSASQEVDPIG